MIEVIRPGQFTTIQDLGRFGYRSMGVPVSGAMDSASAGQANQLLGNAANAAIIEMAYVGATFLFHSSAIVCFSGASCVIKLNNQIIENQSTFKVEAGSTLSFGALTDGNFSYLAIKDGFKTDKILDSRSYFGALNGISRMEKGMTIHFDEAIQNGEIGAYTFRPDISLSQQIIEVEKGPEFNLLSRNDQSLLIDKQFSISPQSSRMGLQLNERVDIAISEIISSPVQPGTIQLTKGGQLIVLMRDAQTTGGYPRILQLTDESINQLAQIGRKSTFKFELIE